MAHLLSAALRDARRALRRPGPALYWVVYGALLVLSGATAALSLLPLGALHVPVALALAAAKGVLIALFFMHLVEERFSSAMVLSIGLVLVLFLIAATAADVATREPWTRPDPHLGSPAAAP